MQEAEDGHVDLSGDLRATLPLAPSTRIAREALRSTTAGQLQRRVLGNRLPVTRRWNMAETSSIATDPLAMSRRRMMSPFRAKTCARTTFWSSCASSKHPVTRAMACGAGMTLRIQSLTRSARLPSSAPSADTKSAQRRRHHHVRSHTGAHAPAAASARAGSPHSSREPGSAWLPA
jgi:hypothetical protein